MNAAAHARQLRARLTSTRAIDREEECSCSQANQQLCALALEVSRQFRNKPGSSATKAPEWGYSTRRHMLGPCA